MAYKKIVKLIAKIIIALIALMTIASLSFF